MGNIDGTGTGRPSAKTYPVKSPESSARVSLSKRKVLVKCTELEYIVHITATLMQRGDQERIIIINVNNNRYDYII